MPTLFGKPYTRRDLLQRVGDISQVGGVRLAELADGFERGVRIAEFRTGAGFDFTVLADRGLDVAQATYCGIPLAWRSATTAIAPAFYEPEGLGWLRGFQGGLVATCGLTSFGGPGEDAGETFGLHGRASYLPASHLSYGGDWQGDDYVMWVSGELRQARVFGENLVLRRRIAARLGEARLFLEDSVTNEGDQATPLMLLYHCNFGFPLVDETTRLVVDSDVEPRDADAAAGLAEYDRFQPPTEGYREQVFAHAARPGADGTVLVALDNAAFAGGTGLSAYVRYHPEELPCLTQWKMMGRGTYVCGLEPGTNRVGGRAAERAAGRLRTLAPGETRRFNLEIGVVS